MSSGVDVSILIPSIHPDVWENLNNQIEKSINKYNYELLFIGPYYPNCNLQKYKNIRYIQSWASPAVCLQIGACLSYGKYLCWLPDDILIENNAISECINLLNQWSYKEIITIRYSEGVGFTGNQHNWYQYWNALTHDGLRLKQVKNWNIAPVFMCYTEYFKELGGIDCSMEHCNLNCIDFNFRAQLNNSKILLSPTKVFAADWIDQSINNSAIYQAYIENDLPKFKEIWDKNILDRNIKISLNNWEKQPLVWSRRFG